MRRTGSLEPDFADPQLLGDELQFAIRVFGARIAILIMIGEHEFNGNPPHLPKFFGMGFDLHPGLRRGGTGSDNTQTFDIDKTKPTGSVDAQFGVITKCRNFDADFSDNFQQVPFVIKANLCAIDC